MRKLLILLLQPVCLALALMQPVPALSQDLSSTLPEPTAVDSTARDTARIAELISGLEQIPEPDESQKAELELYREALRHYAELEQDQEAVSALTRFIDIARDEKTRLESELEAVRQESLPQPWVAGVLGMEELEQRLDQAQAEAKLADARLTDLEARRANERLSPELQTGELAGLRQRLQQIDGDMQALDEQQAGATGLDARRTALVASRRASQAAISRLEIERLSHAPRMEQLDLQAALLRSRLNQSAARIQVLQELLTEKRKADVEKVRAEAVQVEQAAIGKHDLIMLAAETNAQLGQSLGRLTGQLAATVADNNRVNEELQHLRTRLDRATQQLEFAVFDESLGTLLRSERNALPDTRKVARSLDQSQRKLAEIRLTQLRTQDLRQAALAKLLAYGQGAEGSPDDVSGRDWPAIRVELEKLLQDRLGLLQRLQSTSARYEQALVDLELAQGQRLKVITQYQALLDRNLIWIPDFRPMDRAMLQQLAPGFLSLLEWERARDFANGIYHSLLKQPLRLLLLIALVLVLLAIRPRMRRSLREMAPMVGNVTRDRFTLTFRALFITLVFAAPWVLLVMGLGLLLSSEPKPIGGLVSTTLVRFSLYLLFVQFGRYLFIGNGLAEVHFRWGHGLIRTIRRYLRLLLITFVPLASIMIMIHVENDPELLDSLGRAVSLIWLVTLIFVVHKLLNPWSGAGVGPAVNRGLALSWRLLFYMLAMLMLLFLAFLQYSGYSYTTARLHQLIMQSGLVLLFVLVAYHLAVRWLLVAERRLALARAREKRQAAQEARAAKEAAEAAGESIQELPELEEINLSAISEQTRNLLMISASSAALVALALIWSELTPAFGRLDEMVLWEYTVTRAGLEQMVPVSLWDLGLNLLVVTLMIVAGRNLPGLLEIAVLQPLRIDRGTRYAVSQISRYLIYGAGTMIAFGMLGVGWGDVQWLVAAMGVGLGFGLQEIFANFISGLMILFERPIRIGDTVTIGNISGIVTRIRMRATTITDWDNKELIVPNKSFVTDPLINWTLSDETTRVVIVLGIAYGSDVARAHQLMVDLVRAHPDVLEEPQPTVFFTGFGDSSLNFEIRAFVKDRVMRMPLIHDLHMELDSALREAGIEIPFPQRDLHLRSVDQGIDLGRRKD